MTAQNLTSKKSYFGSYIRYRIFKNKNLLILSFVFSAMYMLLFTGCMMFCTGFVNDFINSGAITEEGVSKTMGTVDVVKATGEVILAISAVVLFILTIVVSNVMFSYNLKKCDGDMYLPLPLTTTQRFFADLISGSVICILPLLLTGIVSTAMAALSGVTLTSKIDEMLDKSGSILNIQELHAATNKMLFKDIVGVAGYILIASVIVLLLVYAFCVMVNACAGRTADSVIYSLLGMIVAALFITAGISIVMGRVTSYLTNEEMFSLAMLAAPLGTVFSFVGSFVAGNSYDMYSVDGVLDRHDIFTVFSLRNMTVVAVIFVIYLGLAYLATRLRKAEKTGSPFVFELPYHIITLGLVMSLFAWITGVTGLNSHNTTSFVTSIVISVILYFFAELTHGRKFRKMWQSLIRYVCAVIGSLAMCFVLRSYDVFGVEHYVPPTFFIDSVGISSSKVYNEFCNISFGESNIVEFDDEESIKAITDYHSFIINNGYGYAGGNGIIIDASDGEADCTDNSSVSLRYKLKDGSHMTRTYRVTVCNDNSAEYAKKLYDMQCVLSESDSFQKIFDYVKKTEHDILIHRNDGELYGRTLKSELNGKMLTAMKNDMKAGRNNGRLVATVDFVKTGTPFSDGSINIRENCTETLAILENYDNSSSNKEKITNEFRQRKREYEAEKASSEYGDDFYEYATAADFDIYTIMKMTQTSRVYYYTGGAQAIYDDIIHVDCDGNDSEAVKELEKLCRMYDFYTDGALCSKSWMLSSASTYAFGSAIYFIPDENKIRADKLIKTIKEEHYTSEPSTSDD